MKNRLLIFLLVLATLSPLLILREATPSNELRYLNIVDQALESGNLFTFYDHSTPYADKPPLYFWEVMLLKKIAGGHLMFFLSLLSLVPAFVTGWVLDKWIGKYLPSTERAAALLMLLTSGFFLAGGVVLRQDMLMTMFITLSLYTFYKLYQNTSGARDAKSHIKSHDARQFKKNRLLLPLYVFLGIFSKGAIGFLVPVVAIVVFLLLERNLRIGRYLGWRFWGILILLCGLWFTGVYIEGGEEYLNNLLFHQTLDRAVNSFHHKAAWWFYLVAWWYIFAPWGLLVVTSCISGVKAGIFFKSDSRLMVVTALSTLIMLSLISSKIAIYALPIIPFFIYLASLSIAKRQSSWGIKLGVWLPAILFIAIFPASFLIPEVAQLQGVTLPNLWAPLPVLAICPLIGGVVAIVFLLKNRTTSAIISIAIAELIMLLMAGASTKEINKITSAQEICEKAVNKVATKNTAIYYYKFAKAPNLDYYFKASGLSAKELDTEGLKTIKSGIVFFKEKYLKRDSLLNIRVLESGSRPVKGGAGLCFIEIK